MYGLGGRSTPEAFVAACDQFIYLDLLTEGPPESSEPRADLKSVLSTAISGSLRDDGWSHLADVGSYLRRSHPAFDSREYGHRKLGDLVREAPYVEVRSVAGPTGASVVWVRLR